MSDATPASDPAPRGRSRRWLDAFTWGGTALMLATYFAMSLKKMDVGPAFFACQLFGQWALILASVSKRAWEPAIVNVAFAIASVIGLVRSVV